MITQDLSKNRGGGSSAEVFIHRWSEEPTAAGNQGAGRTARQPRALQGTAQGMQPTLPAYRPNGGQVLSGERLGGAQAQLGQQPLREQRGASAAGGFVGRAPGAG